MKIKEIYKQVLWIAFLTLYPIVATVFLFYSVLKDSGYAGMVLIPVTGFFLIGCFIVNIIAVSITTKNVFPFSIYTVPVFTPMISALFLLDAFAS